MSRLLGCVSHCGDRRIANAPTQLVIFSPDSGFVVNILVPSIAKTE